jgi:hypothetical protein
VDNFEANRYVEKQYLMTNVRHEDKWFMVSTINRLSSCDYPTEFSETIVWEWLPEEKKRGEMLGEFAGYAGSPIKHFLCVEYLLKDGSIAGAISGVDRRFL